MLLLLNQNENSYHKITKPKIFRNPIISYLIKRLYHISLEKKPKYPNRTGHQYFKFVSDRLRDRQLLDLLSYLVYFHIKGELKIIGLNFYRNEKEIVATFSPTTFFTDESNSTILVPLTTFTCLQSIPNINTDPSLGNVMLNITSIDNNILESILIDCYSLNKWNWLLRYLIYSKSIELWDKFHNIVVNNKEFFASIYYILKIIGISITAGLAILSMIKYLMS